MFESTLMSAGEVKVKEEFFDLHNSGHTTGTSTILS